MKGKQPQGKAGHEESVPGGDQQEVEGTERLIRGGAKGSWVTRRTQNGKDGSEACPLVHKRDISRKSTGNYSLLVKQKDKYSVNETRWTGVIKVRK